MNKTQTSIYLFVFFLGLCLVSVSCATKNSKPNVVFILVDDLGWTDLKSYGSDFYQTPNIDQLVEIGVKFTNAYSTSNVCSPTRASILTGKYPATLRLTDYIPGTKLKNKKLLPPEWTQYLDTSEVTIAEIFKNNGYKTTHIGKWHLGNDSLYWPENQGFNTNIGGWAKGSPILNKNKNAFGYFSPYGNPKLDDRIKGEYLTNRLASEAKNFIENNKDTPFFLNLWFYSVHTPLQADTEKIQKYRLLNPSNKNHNNPIYAAMIEHMDEAVGTIIKTLKDLKLDQNTIIVFTSDNGGLVGNNPRFTKEITNNKPLRSGKGDIYEGGVRVPCVFYYPKKIKPRIEDTPIISIDFLPTLVELVELKGFNFKGIDGVSLAALLVKNKPIKSRSLFWHYPHYHSEGAVPYSSIRSNGFKLIHNLETNELELYNLENDLSENKNLILNNTYLAECLFMKLNDWKESIYAQAPKFDNL